MTRLDVDQAELEMRIAFNVGADPETAEAIRVIVREQSRRFAAALADALEAAGVEHVEISIEGD